MIFKRQYEVWMEGYDVTGNHGDHLFIGKVKARTFKEACAIACKAYFSPETFERYYNYENMSLWGCKCYDNEEASMYYDRRG